MHCGARACLLISGSGAAALLAFAAPAPAPQDPLPSWNDGPAKRSIIAFVAAATNAEYTAGGGGARLMLLVHHDDCEREYCYDRESHVGRLDTALDEARRRGWTVVSMRKDWRYVYPFERERVRPGR